MEWARKVDITGKVLKRCPLCDKATLVATVNGEEVAEKCLKCGWYLEYLFDSGE
jgi:Zn ribbon nucleic-acid-binding protein